MPGEPAQFDPIRYKETTREQWQTVAEPWYRWGPTIEEWLGQATETMLDMAEIGPGSRCSRRGRRRRGSDDRSGRACRTERLRASYGHFF